ncbi:MAG: Holliday junction branch migration protein RuvA [Pseudomonadota bacterium]
MIGKLSGIIDSISSNFLLLDVQGVGYLVYASNRTLARIGQSGDTASLLIETQVREDAITLFGFADVGEKEWFNLLASVQGVGAKAGLSILSVCPPEQLTTAIMAQDKAALTQADGVGPKLATRILTELKDKVGKMDISTSAAPVKYADIASDEPQGSALDGDAVSALVNLGYSRSDAFTAVTKAKAKSNDNLEELIRVALKELSA